MRGRQAAPCFGGTKSTRESRALHPPPYFWAMVHNTVVFSCSTTASYQHHHVYHAWNQALQIFFHHWILHLFPFSSPAHVAWRYWHYLHTRLICQSITTTVCAVASQQHKASSIFKSSPIQLPATTIECQRLFLTIELLVLQPGAEMAARINKDYDTHARQAKLLALSIMSSLGFLACTFLLPWAVVSNEFQTE